MRACYLFKCHLPDVCYADVDGHTCGVDKKNHNILLTNGKGVVLIHGCLHHMYMACVQY